MKPTDIELIYELSPMQQAMLFHSLYAPGSGVYVLQMSLRLTGRLDIPAFERAWRHIVERHAILRTSFFWEDLEKPLQVVYQRVDLDVTRLSWSDLDTAGQQARLAGWLDADRERGFELTEAPLMRLALIELGPDVHQLIWTQHHLVVDGWSQGQLLRELFVAYAELAAGREPRMEPARSFREYVSWLQQQEPGQAESFWRESLAGFSSPTFLAEGDDKPAGPSFRASRREVLALSAETTSALRETARRNRLTLNTLVQGAWALLLAQVSDREDVVFGTTVAGRPPELPGVETIVGPFINTLPVRVAARPESPLREWLGGLQRRLAEMRRYEHTSLVEIQRWSELPGGMALFDHILVFENVALPQELSHQLPGLDIEEEAAVTLTNYPLNVIVVPGTELALSILYDASRFEAAEAVRTLARLAHVLTVFSEDLDPWLAELPMLPPAEQEQILAGGAWSATEAAPSGGRCLHELLADRAERTPDAAARATYAELAERASGLARHLRGMGVGPEVRVAVCLERSPDLFASLLGVLAAGGAYVPVDPADPAVRRAFLLEDSGAAVLVTRRGLVEEPLPGWLRRLDLDSFQESRDVSPASPSTSWPLSDRNLACVIYTSGLAAGRPRGLAIEHRSAVELAAAAPDAFDLSVFDTLASLAWGGPLPERRTRVADRRGHLAPIGVGGELWLAGAGLARGYLGRPDLTAERFTPDPYGASGERVYRTRDRARLRPHETLGLELEILRARRHLRPIPPLVPVPRDAGLPLSFAQQRLWSLDRLNPENPAWNLAWTMRWSGALDTDLLDRCFTEVVRRHEALRTTFTAPGGRPVQVIAGAGASRPALARIDLSHHAEDQRTAEARRLAREEALRPFDLAEGPLLRITLVRLSAAEHLLLLTLHHIVADSSSMGVLVREIEVLYEAFSRGQESPLPELTVQPADFAVWQRTWLQGDALEEQLAFWRRHLDGAPLQLELPADRPRSVSARRHAATRPVALPASLSREVAALSRNEGLPPFITLLSAFGSLLGRAAGQEDLLVGSLVAHRNRPEIQGLIGLFENLLVLRMELAKASTFRDLLDQVRHTTLDAYAHQDLPFERLVEELAPDREAHQSPLVQVLFALHNAPLPALRLPGIELAVLPPEPGAAKVDLTLVLQEMDGRLAGTLEYDADLFDPTTMDRLLAHFAVLLAGAVEDPDREIGALPLLTSVERHQALVEWNDSASAWPRGASLAELFASLARDQPDAPAVISEGRVWWTYRELDAAANALARRLRDLGAGPEVAVGLSMERSPELILAVLAIVKAGGAYVPLDPGYPDERIAFMLADTGAQTILVHDRTRERFAGRTGIVPVDPRAAGAAEHGPDVQVGDESLALVIYTSGSTGRPKGVALPQRGIVRLVRESNYLRLDRRDRMAHAASISFDAATLEIWGALLQGAALAILPRETVLSPSDLAASLERDGVTTLFLTTALFNQMAREEPEALARLRTVMFGGEAADPVAVAQALREGGPERLLHLYGPAESTTLATWHRVREVPPGALSVPIGLPVASSTVHVLDRRQAPVPVGTVGELCVGGDGLARGYLNRPELTAERFIPHPWASGERLYRTGDLVRRRADGAVEFVGRGDDQIKIRGFRIELGEIEAVLAGHPGIRESAVVARRDDGGLRLVAYAVLHRTDRAEPTDRTDLQAWLRERLPPYMVPSAVVLLDALPLTANGKLDRRALPAPEPAAVEAEASGAPADPVEELLAGIWAEVLKLPRVGARDDFFALGGHSLLATQVVSRIRSVLGVDLPLRSLFEAPTVTELARLVRESRQGVAVPPIVPRPRGGDLPLSFAQQRLWLLDQLEPGNPAYNIPLAVRLTGEISAEELARIFAAVIRRHEALRTTFASRDGKPVQVIAPSLRPDVPVTDLSHLPEAEREERARRLALEEARRPFDLEHGPLLRLALARLGEREHLLAVTLHHIVSDGWSMGVLLREVAALSDPTAAPLPELPVQYADFAGWQREWMQGEVLEAQLAYWRRQLAGAPRALELPTDRPRPAVQTYTGALQPVALSPDLTEAVQRLCRQQGATPFMALLAAWAVLLGRHAGQDDVLIGSPIAGRNRSEVEGLIGFFVNTLVLRADLRGEPAFGELLERIRQAALDGYAHQDVPFERLVEELVPERDLAVSPLFQAFFALQNAPVGELTVPGLSLAPVLLDGGLTKFDLSLSLGEGPSGFAGALEHNTDLFDGGTVERLWARFLALLEAAAVDPAVAITDLPLLLPAEREQLAGWNETGAAPSPGPCLHELFAAQAQRTPNAVALVHGSVRWTYAELAARAGGLACHLRALGVGPEVRVAVCLERSPDLIAALLGVLAAGGAYVPIDPAYPPERRAFMLEDSAAALLLDRIPEISPADLPVGMAAPGHLAYVIYTSGSTGRPKGVAIEHRSAVALVGWAREEFSAEELSGVLASTSVCFDLSVFEIFVPLACGGTIHLVDNALALAAAGAGREIRLLNTVPSAAAELLRLDALPPSVRTVCLAGEPLPAALAARLYATGTVQRVLNLYGPSEDTTYSTGALALRDDPRAPAIGRPVHGTRAHVVDRRGTLVPPGVAGELWLAGAGLARGYLGRPELTAERFTPDPFGEGAGERVYRTGDLVRWRAPWGSNAELEFLGRIDHQVKLRGFRIELGEIEAVLASHPAIREAVAQVWEDAGDRRLVAWVTLDRTDRTDQTDLTSILSAWLREKLPEYMVPAVFVVLDALPLSPNGKVDRKALPAPDRARHRRLGEIVAPRTQTEKTVAEIWKELLGLEQVGVDDPFFELGGHSLLATQVLARVRKTFGVDLPLREIFKRPTIAGLSELIDAQAAPADEDELAALLAELDHLSDDEARERLEAIRLEGDG